jgi:hypothetical protein
MSQNLPKAHVIRTNNKLATFPQKCSEIGTKTKQQEILSR